jgi:hypothetical protein
MLTRPLLRRSASVAVSGAVCVAMWAAQPVASMAATTGHGPQLQTVAAPSYSEWGLDAAMAYDADTHQVVSTSGRAFTDVCACDGTGGTWAWDGSDMHQVGPAGSGVLYSRLVFDAATHQLLRIGGMLPDEKTAVGTTSVWTGSGWQTLDPAHPLSPRGAGAAAYDATTGQLIVFGGAAAPAGGPTGDTVAWTGTDWQELSPHTSPPGRTQAAMAYDDATGQLVLYGGNSLSGFLSDTWTWNGTTWHQRTPAHNPGAIINAAMAYDPALQALVLFGGQSASGLGSTPGPAPVWKWNGSDWVQLTGATGPAGVVWPSMAYDPDHGQLLILAPLLDKPNGVSHQFLLLDAPTQTTSTAVQSAAGQPLTVTTTVRAKDVLAVGGSVSVTIDGRAAATCSTLSLVAGTASCQVVVAPGQHTVHAVYTAGAGFVGSSSSKVAVTTS